MMDKARIVAAATAFLCANLAASGAIIWTGPRTTFTKVDGADWTLPQNQDHLTDQVWITRGSDQGIINIRQESGYTHDLSPIGTEWAFGSAANWQSLAFKDWETWAKPPPAIVGQPAVMHLINEDIYLDVKFLSWTSRGGGGFSYERSTVPEPSGLALLAAGGIGLLGRSRRRGGAPLKN